MYSFLAGKDFLCVQSMDGTVSFFEQESFSFSRFLPGFLLPGPLKYVPRTDSFVTVSSSWQVESYKYQVLAVATDVKTKEESQTITSGKRITVSAGTQKSCSRQVALKPPTLQVEVKQSIHCALLQFNSTGNNYFLKVVRNLF